MKQFPILFCKGKTGKIKQWQISVLNHPEENYAEIITDYGFSHGNLKQSVVTITKGKNIGKANETTVYQQALLEAESKYQKKLKDGYVTEPHGESKRLLPMLAQEYLKYPQKLDTDNYYVQPKLNGVRCLAKREGDRILYYSRQGNLFETLNHLDNYLLNILNDSEIFDGEIYNHSLSLQEIVSILKSGKENKGRDKLEYWVYDIVESDTPFNERLIKLQRKKDLHLNTKINFVPTYNQREMPDLNSAHTIITGKGYEGIMLRNGSGKYEIATRSYNLLKFKKFQSEEFEIIAGKEGIGKEKGCVIFTCQTKDGKPFDVRPKGSLKDRRQMYYSLDQYLGKMMTVNFFNYTRDGVPFHPVGEVVRDYE